MPDSFTAILGLTKPEIGASRDTWGTKLNGDLDLLDQFVGMAMPIGSIIDFAGPQPPAGWLVCDGRAVSRTTYSALYGVVANFWGAGDGSTTFNLPNLVGRSGVGPGTLTDQAGRTRTYSFGSRIGYIWNVIAQGNLPNYQLYCDTQGYHAHGGATANAGAHYHTTDAQGNHSHSGNTTTESTLHTHYATTDTQGDHSHSVPNTYASGPGGLAPGGFSFGGASTTSVNGAHAHNVSVGTESAYHVHGIYADGNHAHTTTWASDHAHGIYGDGSHSHAVWLGGSGALFELQNPVAVVTKIIYAGRQAAPAVMSLDVEPTMTIEGRDELAALRDELDQLRAIVGLARPRRVLSAPMRGSH